MASRFLITAASEMQAVAVAWQVYALTHRPLDLGLVGLAQFLPGILLFLLTGHTADRFPRRRILQICYAAFAGCSLLLLALTVHDIRRVYPIYVALLLNGTIRAFHWPAAASFLPTLVDAADFSNAVAWSSSTFKTATIIGPAIGGAIYAWTGSPLPVYACAAAAYAIAFLLISAVRVRSAVRSRAALSLRAVLEGLRFIWRNQPLLGVISLDLFAVLLGGAVALLPVYASEILSVGPSGLGLLRAGPGIGAVLTSIAVAHWPLRRRAGAAMLWCVVGFGVFTVVFGVSRSVVISMAALILTGVCDTISVIVRQTMVQLGTPDEMRGRVNAVNMVFIGASNEVGQFESGITAQWFGAVPAVVLGGVGTIAVVAAWAWLFPALRGVELGGDQPARVGSSSRKSSTQ